MEDRVEAHKPKPHSIVRITATLVNHDGRYVRSKGCSLYNVTPEEAIARIKAMADDAELVNQS